MSAKPFHFAMLTHPGRVRRGNEDICDADADAGAFVVCDGMGGAAAGEVASSLASQVFLKSIVVPRSAETGAPPRTATPDVRLDEAIHAANIAVYKGSRSSAHLHGMGCTLVALLLQPAANGAKTALTLAHVGDSRCYLFRDGILTLLTSDHSLVEEQVRLGEMTPVEAEYHPMRNIITRAVGSQPTVEAEIRNLEPEQGDIYLLASDGLTRELKDPEISLAFQRFLAQEKARKRVRPDLFLLCQTLIDQANDAGGGDNITVLLLQLP